MYMNQICSQVTISIQILVLYPLLYSKRSKNNINRLKKCEQEYYHMYMNQICSKVTIESPLLLLSKSPNPDGSIITPWSQHMNISRVPTHTVHSSWMSTQHTTRSQPFCYLQTTETPSQMFSWESRKTLYFWESRKTYVSWESRKILTNLRILTPTSDEIFIIPTKARPDNKPSTLVSIVFRKIERFITSYNPELDRPV